MTCIEPPQITTGFLTYYDNPARRLLPAERIFPVGQKMLLADANCVSEFTINHAASNGFTTVMGCRHPFGPDGITGAGSEGDLLAKYATDRGMRLYPAPSPTWPGKTSVQGNYNGIGQYDDFCGFKGQPLEDFTPQYDLLHGLYRDNNFAGFVDGIWLFPEEGICGLDPDSGGYSCFGGDLSWITPIRQQLIQYWLDLDIAIGVKLPITTPEVESLTYVDFQCWDKNSASIGPESGKQFDALGPEAYVDRLPSQHGFGRLTNNIMGIRKITNDLNAVQSPPSGYNRTHQIVLSYIFCSYTQTDTYWHRFGFTSIWLCAVMGVQQIILWRALPQPTGSRLALQGGYHAAVKKLTDYDFDKAFMWGNWSPANPLSITHPGGQTWVFSSSAVVGPNKYIESCDIQYGNTRYVGIVNTHYSLAITVTIGNLPTEIYNGTKYELVDCLTGNVSDINNSTKQVTLVPNTNNVAIYKIRLRGWTTEIPHCDITTPPLTSKVKVSGLWRTIKSSKVKVSGTWRAIKSSKIKVNGIWENSILGIPVIEPPIDPPIDPLPSGTVPTTVNFNSGSSATITISNIQNTTSYQWYFQFPGNNTWYIRDVDRSNPIVISGARDGYVYRCLLTGPGGSVYTNSCTTVQI